jgi:virginiamycin B lyase
MQRAPRLRSLAHAALLAGGLLSAARPARSATVTEYPLTPGSAPQGIALGPDGNVWFAENGGNKVGRITPAGSLTELPLPVAQSLPSQIVLGSGDVYYSAGGVGKVGYVDALGDLSLHQTSSQADTGLAFGPKGWLWKTNGTNQVAFDDVRFSSSGVGCTLTDGFPHSFFGIAAGPGNVLLIADAGSNAVEALDVSGCNFGKLISLPNPDSGPNFITVGQDGAIWFTEYFGNRIGRWKAGAFVEYTLPPGSAPQMIAAAPDGTLWFAEQGTNRIGSITHAGVITHYDLPTPASAPYGVAVGPDGSIWFTEESASKIGRIRLHPSGDANGDGIVAVDDVFYLINFLFGGGPAPI